MSLAFLAAAVILSLFTGCSETAPNDLVPVTGRVLLDGKPLESGSVSLRPESRETWHQPTGTLAGPEGTYVVYTSGRPGAPPGTYRVVVFASASARTSAGAAHPGMPKSLIPSRYNDPQSTPLRIVVPSVGSSPSSGPSAEPPTFDLEIVSHAR